jgi:hypothetical protein
MKTRTVRSVALVVSVLVMAVFVMAAAPMISANGKPKKTAAKKKSRSTTTVVGAKAAPSGGGARNFTCTGSEADRVTERTVTGTVDAKLVLTNVTVTQNYQEVNGAVVQQSMVVVKTASPRLKPDDSSTDGLITYFLNELPRATAADVGKFAYLYQFNLKDPRPVGPEFISGMYYGKYIGIEGSASNDPRWSYTDVRAFDMKCSYV